MRMTLADIKAPVDYINPHATSTPIGDLKEIEAIREVFGARCPPIAATKSLTGHSLGSSRSAGGDLFHSDDEERLYLRKRQHREARSGIRRGADRSRTPRQCKARLRAVQLVRIWWHQCFDRPQAPGCLRTGCLRKVVKVNWPVHKESSQGSVINSEKMTALMQGKRGLIMGVANDHLIE